MGSYQAQTLVFEAEVIGWLAKIDKSESIFKYIYPASSLFFSVGQTEGDL